MSGSNPNNAGGSGNLAITPHLDNRTCAQHCANGACEGCEVLSFLTWRECLLLLLGHSCRAKRRVFPMCGTVINSLHNSVVYKKYIWHRYSTQWHTFIGRCNINVWNEGNSHAKQECKHRYKSSVNEAWMCAAYVWHLMHVYSNHKCIIHCTLSLYNRLHHTYKEV